MTSPTVRLRNGPAVAHYPPGATLGPRVLPCYEFVWMLTGRASWRHTLGAGDPRVLDVLGLALDLFVRGPAPEDGDSALPEHLLRLVDQLRVVWRGDRTRALALPELAVAAGVSPGHLSRLFRQRSPVGPVAAVELVRLARAAILLQRSNLSIGAISEACGFVNPFHFSRRFRAVYATAPRTYRMSRHSDPLDPLRAANLLALARPLLAEDS